MVMQNGKGYFYVLCGIILAGVVTTIVFYVFQLNENENQESLHGYIDEKQLADRKKYFETLVNSYDPEPLWTPKYSAGGSPVNSSVTSGIETPEIQALAGMIIDLRSGSVLFEKNSTERRPIASLVKIMTAIIVLEHAELEDEVIISTRAAQIGENTMALTAGEVYTVKELLYGLILNSGNDAAYALAEKVAGDEMVFTYWMNLKAGELGLTDTYFAEPSGLDDNSYSTPKDLLKLTRYALKSPIFRELAKTVEIELTGTKHKNTPLYNQTNLLTTYPGVAGVKTGYTEKAGLCLVSYAENAGKEIVGVVLNSPDRKGDMILLLDHGFRSLGVEIEHTLLD